MPSKLKNKIEHAELIILVTITSAVRLWFYKKANDKLRLLNVRRITTNK